jgi:hypothetical protein
MMVKDPIIRAIKGIIKRTVGTTAIPIVVALAVAGIATLVNI